ncbi:MAG: FMN-binding protein, partial [Clostridiales bacterium]|nr:FMN-binding protein [Clostridiales bacterium]
MGSTERKKTMKRTLAILAALLLIASVSLAEKYTAGTYSAEANGNNGPVTVEVTVTDDEIVSVEVTSHSET